MALPRGKPSAASGGSVPFNVDLRTVGSFNATGYRPESDHPPVGSLRELLEQEELAHLLPVLSSETLTGCVGELVANRPHFLSKLSKLGVRNLADRQALANALLRAKRERRIQPSSADQPLSLETMSVKELRALITTAGLGHADCVEKPQLVERARAAKVALTR